MSATTTKVWCADPRCGHAKGIHTARGCPLCTCDCFTADAEWNPVFEAYAMAHGTSPAAMLQYDAERFPGGKMAGFLSWVTLRRAEFEAKYPDGNLAAWLHFVWNE